ncbi:protein suppressor 2 of zeste [Odontomachus brunneus]|uniref:protein suppressor 2 of zeste n=1 Tax=Odontomachus brunneus TaxID=486640 RepID=UPI0013F254CE|nr:protein suppressor 2 of zeste [Odontomachus brunneus]
MYGLYRAWFGGGAAATSNYPCLQDTFSPPDTVVRVGNEGEHQFVAHKGVLAAHSGYLKALLTSTAATTTMSTPSSSGDGSDGGGGGGGSSASASCSPFDPACATVAAVTIGQSQRSQPVTSVSVSSVGGEAFAPLLNYMYTGRLEVTLDNVYSVLLATHLLHMPGALEQCRAALLRLRAPPALPTPMPTSTSTAATSPPGTGSILRPIPSRLLVGPPLCWPPTTPLYAPTAPAPASVAMPHLPQMPPSVLMQPTVPPSINVVAPGTRDKQEQCAHYSVNEVSTGKSPQSSPTHTVHHRKRQRPSSRSRTPEIVSTVALPFVAAAAAAFTAFAVTSGATNSTRASSPSRSISPAPSTVSRTHSPTATVSSQHHNHKSMITATSEREIETQQHIAPAGRSCNDPQHRSISGDDGAIRSRGNNSNNGDTTSEHSDRARSSRRRARSGTSGAKETTTGPSSASSSSTVFSVVYDIACCDGPVRFHRVLNENYSSSTSYGVLGGGGGGGGGSGGSGGGSAQTRGPQQRNCQADREDLSSENDENGGPTAMATVPPAATTRGGIVRSPSNDSSNDGSNGAANNAGNCYTCGYCKHTFKSQYCYRKHAKRHLLPTRINEGAATGDAANDSAPRQEAARATTGRREVRLLDLNVQYYPCKICGCKFPSYYFVHKHRKLCHANDEEGRGAAVAADAGGGATPRDMVDAP